MRSLIFLNDERGKFVLNTTTLVITQLHLAPSLAVTKRGQKSPIHGQCGPGTIRKIEESYDLLGGARRTLNHSTQQ